MSKKFSLDYLSKISEKIRSKNKVIGLCHGVFDIIHAGHIAHFEEVKKKCDYLFVTITEDKFVNKGPNRPINNHYLRAKVLESVKYIDYVGINFSPDASKVINILKPKYYFKGKDYENKKDFTSKLDLEIKAIKKNKGKIIFTEAPLKSSTEIINKTFPYIFDTKLQKFLSNKNKDKIYDNCIIQLEKIKKLKVLIVGDSIIDQYDTVKVLNKPIKENLLATRYLNSSTYLGGIFAAATNLSQFNKNISVLSVIGKDKDIKSKLNLFKKNIEAKIFIESKKLTTRKKRFIDAGYNKKISEVYYMDDNLLGKSNLKKVLNYLHNIKSKFDVIILIDYGHGFLNNEIYKLLRKKTKFLAINCQTNSANLGFNLITKYKKADYICVDEPELRLATSNNTDPIDDIVKKQLSKKINCKNITITRGPNGCFSYKGSKKLFLPAVISEKVIDTIGAGDVFLVLSSLLHAVKSDQITASLIGNIAGALKVDILGHSKAISYSNFYSVLRHILK